MQLGFALSRLPDPPGHIGGIFSLGDVTGQPHGLFFKHLEERSLKEAIAAVINPNSLDGITHAAQSMRFGDGSLTSIE